MSFNYQTAEHTRGKIIENVLQLPWSLQNYILTILLKKCSWSKPVNFRACTHCLHLYMTQYKGEKLNTQHLVAYDDSYRQVWNHCISESIILRSLFILHILSENRQWINEKYRKNFYWLKYMLQVKMVIFGHCSQQFTANTSELKTTQAK